MTYFDDFYTVFQMHDLIERSRTVKGLEPYLGSTVQENAFFD